MRVERHSLLSAYRRQTTKQLSAVFSDLGSPCKIILAAHTFGCDYGLASSTRPPHLLVLRGPSTRHGSNLNVTEVPLKSSYFLDGLSCQIWYLCIKRNKPTVSYSCYLFKRPVSSRRLQEITPVRLVAKVSQRRTFGH